MATSCSAGRQVRVRGGRAELADGSSLAGSTLTLDHALRQAVRAGIEFRAALAAVTSTPARALGLGHVCGTIAPERDADLVVLDDDIAVRGVMRGGAWVVSPQTSRA